MHMTDGPREERSTRAADLAGKDWLTEPEAALYCCVSMSQFRTHASDYGLTPKSFMGKKLYEKAALYRAIADAPPWGGYAGQALRGPATVAISPEVARRLEGVRTRPYRPRKGRPES